MNIEEKSNDVKKSNDTEKSKDSFIYTSRTYNELEIIAENYESAHMYLDDIKIPKFDENGNVFSLVGRICHALFITHENAKQRKQEPKMETKKVFTRKHAEELIYDFQENYDSFKMEEVDQTLESIFVKIPYLRTLGVEFFKELPNMSCGDLEDILKSMASHLTYAPFEGYNDFFVFDDSGLENE